MDQIPNADLLIHGSVWRCREDRRRIAELELSQAQCDASLAERSYAACDPDNRLIAAQLEKAWEAVLQRVEACRRQLNGMRSRMPMEKLGAYRIISIEHRLKCAECGHRGQPLWTTVRRAML